MVKYQYQGGHDHTHILFAGKQEGVMSIIFYNIIFYIALFVFSFSAEFFFTSFYVTIRARRGKKCTRKSTATITKVIVSRGRDEIYDNFEIKYTCDGIIHTVSVPLECSEGVNSLTPVGTQVTIWYDPKKPKRVIISEDPHMEKTIKSWKCTRKHSLIWMLIFAGIMAYAFPRMEETSTMTTIGQFSEEISELADKTPTALVYTESIGSPGTFTAMVDDPAIAKKALDIILSAAVDKRGCQVDMYQMHYEEYCFVFGEEHRTFGFVSQSYFCYDGKYYELGENQLAEVRSYLHEMMSKEETAWSRSQIALLSSMTDSSQ